MAQTEYLAKIRQGPIDNKAVTLSLVAKVATLTLWSPVVLADGSITAMPTVNSTTTSADVKVIGVLVRLPRKNFVAGVSLVEVVVFGICKIVVADSDVSLNDALVTSTSAGKAAVQSAFTIRADTAANVAADAIAALKGVRACFAIALTTVTSGANSIIACFVNIVPYAGAVAAGS